MFAQRTASISHELKSAHFEQMGEPNTKCVPLLDDSPPCNHAILPAQLDCRVPPLYECGHTRWFAAKDDNRSGDPIALHKKLAFAGHWDSSARQGSLCSMMPPGSSACAFQWFPNIKTVP